ncbi:NAD(P)H-dependent oxidoreductase [Limosilactobacillus vaginalis]|jgi:NAD(P)H-dependent FMN reductase|uniref:NAD(P)H-dependent oxidoreductase n=2 Tax=Lactobacillaceae TaxID=33958 RepID=A0ABT4KC24_9LACO|nr:NAD(P)H-dependent oxidoreductase [Limosilactobacillus vaginalis]MCI6852398.1 NAD(P)H-dependent oxidoreductase [Limosilactobacillus vaginalis]MCZ3747486.1 NAD(P)H-dependent oxidoreductase [Limosilactobacillus vaginalis]MCZ3752469.1 NAD(P)H-dependent oxidoreductase [Limosilactobacillus vaginalis]MCZ3754195.1 NAD(P)H-dependent oxidoreductase [Limosilactobacillus vaginalis]MCZ3755916.1 NAD(P)H-dependent oxidoreductase [Limosilactobacillus vaginalis]
MMKILAFVGTNADFSYNRLLLRFMKKHFKQMADIEIYEVGKLPPFSVDTPLSEQTEVWKLKQKVKEADGLVFSTPEYDHGIPAVLKSAIEWLSYKTKVLSEKPAMIVGVAYGRQASARSQVQMRQILISPDCNTNLIPGNEVLIGNVRDTFAKDGRLVDQEAIDNLEKCFEHFIEYIQIFKNTDREGLDMAIKQPTISDAYINFPTGRLTLKEVQQIFSTIPFEVDLIDSTDHFAWFSDKPNREHVRNTASLGETVQECHPPMAVPAVMSIINSFREGKKDVVTRPLWMNGHRSLIQYYALRDINGHYLGTIEFTGSVEYILNLFENGAWSKDATTGASKSTNDSAPEEEEPAVDASTGASENSDDSDDEENTPVAADERPAEETDATTGASETGSVDAEDDTADASTGASENDD